MTVTKDQILGALPSLSQGDLQVIKMAAGALLQPGAGDPAQGAETAQGWLFAALQGVTGAAYRVPSSLGPFNKHAPAFLAFTNKYFPVAMTKKVDALALMNGLLQLIATDLKERQAPVTFGTMVVNLPRVGEVFENAFPGYLASGLAALFIKR